MNSQTILEAYQQQEQQLLLFDPEENATIYLRNTLFQKINNEFDRDALIHWWMHVLIPDSYKKDEKTSHEVWKSWYNPLYSYFRFVGPDGSYNSESLQPVVRIKLNKNEPLEPQLAEINLWLPHIKKSAKYDKYFSILETTVSQHGFYRLVLPTNYQEWLVTFTRRGYTQTLVSGSLEKMVDYLRTNHYYE